MAYLFLNNPFADGNPPSDIQTDISHGSHDSKQHGIRGCPSQNAEKDGAENRQGYKNSMPVIIGDKAWLCESCTIMNGVKVGDGAIVGAKAFVISKVPAHSMVSGHPAQVVDEDVLWKY